MKCAHPCTSCDCRCDGDCECKDTCKGNCEGDCDDEGFAPEPVAAADAATRAAEVGADVEAAAGEDLEVLSLPSASSSSITISSRKVRLVLPSLPLLPLLVPLLVPLL